MLAGEIMTRDVLSVGPETPAAEIARCLVERGVSAVPVVDAEGIPVGMVSEGDLIGRDDAKREARRDWWLEMLADGNGLSVEFRDYGESGRREARHIMAAPVITVTDATPVQQVA